MGGVGGMRAEPEGVADPCAPLPRGASAASPASKRATRKTSPGVLSVGGSRSKDPQGAVAAEMPWNPKAGPPSPSWLAFGSHLSQGRAGPREPACFHGNWTNPTWAAGEMPREGPAAQARAPRRPRRVSVPRGPGRQGAAPASTASPRAPRTHLQPSPLPPARRSRAAPTPAVSLSPSRDRARRLLPAAQQTGRGPGRGLEGRGLGAGPAARGGGRALALRRPPNRQRRDLEGAGPRGATAWKRRGVGLRAGAPCRPSNERGRGLGGRGGAGCREARRSRAPCL